ncbi:MFS transporter [Microbacterium gorillae]|uniref:MFS transporter n=1 Tax=Microbacterium gorillae TaxID=1231063 RepID=UPI000B253DE7|nr:MFS transporter [Microbacterium gorillae]
MLSRPSRPRTMRESWLALTGLSLVFLFEMLDNSILNVALPTIGRDLNATTTAVQWVTAAYAVVFGGLMLIFGTLADRIGRRRIMLLGLVLLGVASLATALVTTVGELIAVRAVMGVAAAMTAPGTLALAFRLFDEEAQRLRAMTIISTVGLVGLAIGPLAGGLALGSMPWQTLLLVNVPVAAIAWLAIRAGVPADRPDELHRGPVDGWGALLGTGAILAALLAPTLFVDVGAGSWAPWAGVAAAVLLGVAFVARERRFLHPILDLALIARPLVASGLAFKAAANLAVAGLGYLVTLQLQLAWGWTPAQAAIGMLPQVVVLIAGGAVIGVVVRRWGIGRAAVFSALAVVAGLAVYAFLGGAGYVWVAIALALVAGGMRLIGVVAGNNVMKGVPADRTTLGAALADTAGEVATATGVALSGTILATMFTGRLAAGAWTAAQAADFTAGLRWGGIGLVVAAALLVGVGMVWTRRGSDAPTAAPGRFRQDA